MSHIKVLGCDGSEWHVHGDDVGAEGVALSEKQVDGVYDAPVQTEYRSPARGRGGSHRHTKHLIREVTLGFHIAGSVYAGPDVFERTYSEFRAAFDYQLDEWDDDAEYARMVWETDEYGARTLKLLLSEAPDFKPDHDPLVKQYGNPILPLKAPQPFWEGETVVTSWSTASSTGTGFVTVSNPADVPMYQKWVVTRGNWILPDVSWRGKRGARAPGGEYHDRTVTLPAITTLEQGATVDLDPSELMVRDAADTNLLGRMPIPGQFFMHVIPPHTPPTQLPVAVTGAPAGGAMVQCIQPHLYSKPWG